MANASHYPMPEKLQDWRFWYWSLFPAPFGGGARYYALPSPDRKCMIMSNPPTWPLSRVVDVYAIAPGTKNRDPDAWARGTLAHELTHCFDANADSNADYRKRTALPPYLAVEPKYVIEHAIATNRLDVTAWKEAVADIVQVGYWRLTEGDRLHADSLASDLKRGRKIRAQTEDPDLGHATYCWLDALESEPGPPDLESLFAWANDIRLRTYLTDKTGCRQILERLSKLH